MNTKSNIFIDIITSFKGQANLKRAKTDILGLTSAVKGLAAAYSVEQVVTKSLNAFKEQQVAVGQLDNSLKNLGTSYAALQPAIDKQVNSMIDLGFVDNQSIEALTKLTTALGNPAKAMEALGVAADLARYNNADLVTTSENVAKAIAGQSRAFAALGLKIDKTLTPQNAFNKLLDQASAKAGGAAKAYADTLAGGLDIAAAKADNAAEAFGKGLAPAVQQLADFGVKYVIPMINTLSNHVPEIMATAAAITAVSLAIKAVGVWSAWTAGKAALNPWLLGAAGVGFAASRIAASSKNKPVSAANPSSGVDLQNMGLTQPSVFGTAAGNKVVAKSSALKTEQAKKALTAEQQLAAWMKKWDASALADAKKLADQAAKKLALEKAAKQLKDAGKVLDLQAIQINAALMDSKTSLSDKEKAVLLLQKSLLDENASAATKLAEEVKKASDEHPFAKLTEGADTSKASIEGLTQAMKDFGFASVTAWQDYRRGERGDNPPTPAVPAPSKTGGGLTVINNIAGSVLTHEELASYMQQAIVNSTASGIPSSYDRNKLTAW